MKGINWKDHIINLIVVVFGISIAFQLNNWKANNEKVTLEYKFCDSFLNDLELDIEFLKSLRDTSKHYLISNRRLLNIIEKKNFNNDSLIYHLIDLYAYSEFLPQNVTYETFKSSGSLDILQDFTLTKNITRLYGQLYGYIRIIDNFHREQQVNKLSPYINKHIALSASPRLMNKDFLNDIYFGNLVNGSQYLLLAKIEAYDNALELAEQLHADISAYTAKR